jgi:hypothetical protein
MKRSVGWGITIALIAAIVYSEVHQRSQIDQQHGRIKELEAKLQTATAPQHASLEDQIVCAKQAERAFQSDQHSSSQKRFVEAHFISHYQSSSGRCFVEIAKSSFKANILIASRSINDAITGDLLGLYIRNSNQNTPGWCDMIDSNGHEKYCQSGDEFTELAKQYMK